MTYTSSNNTATHTLTNAAGCDSVVTLNLTINTVDNTTSLTNATASSNAVATNLFEWIDCDNGNNLIAGETNQSFIPTISGNYAVIVSNPITGCVDTSACISITITTGDSNGNGIIDGNELAGDISGNAIIDNDEALGDISGNENIEDAELCGDANGNGVIDNNEIAYDCDGDGIADNVGVNDILEILWSAYPNPTNGKLFITFNDELSKNNKVSIINTLGQEVYTFGNVQSKNINFDASNLSAGTYYIYVNSDNKLAIKTFAVFK